MSWHALEGRGNALYGRDVGDGLHVVFQHGLGGSEAQIAEVFPDGDGFRRLTLDCLSHGRSSGGDRRDLSISAFADDVLAFAGARGVDRFVVGGISMGAAIALRLAVLYPEQVMALVLARPAWLWDAGPANMQPYAEVAHHLGNPDRIQALADFEASETGGLLAREAPDNLASMRGFLAAHNRAGLAALLAAIACDGPGVTEQQVRAIAVPTLVIGSTADLAHPMAFAETLADTISGAKLVRITPKAIDRARYVQEFRAALTAFLSAPALSKGLLP